MQTCSLEVNCDTLAVMGATLANGGECPITGEAALSPGTIRDVLSLMHRWDLAITHELIQECLELLFSFVIRVALV